MRPLFPSSELRGEAVGGWVAGWGAVGGMVGICSRSFACFSTTMRPHVGVKCCFKCSTLAKPQGSILEKQSVWFSSVWFDTHLPHTPSLYPGKVLISILQQGPGIRYCMFHSQSLHCSLRSVQGSIHSNERRRTPKKKKQTNKQTKLATKICPPLRFCEASLPAPAHVEPCRLSFFHCCTQAFQAVVGYLDVQRDLAMGIEASGCRVYSQRFIKYDGIKFNDTLRKRDRYKQKVLSSLRVSIGQFQICDVDDRGL